VTEDEKEMIANAQELARAGQHEEAVEAFEAALRVLPEDADLWHDLGAELAACGRDEEAVNALRRSIDLDANSAYAYISLARAMTRLGRTADAESVYQAGIRVNPSGSDVRYDYAIFLDETGRTNDAIKEYEVLHHLCSNHFETCINLGALYYERNNPMSARQLFQKAIRINPRSPLGYYHLGLLAEDDGDVISAAHYYSKSMELDPTDDDYNWAFDRCDNARSRK